MGATSETQICNVALGRLGTQRILSLNDNLPNARLLKEQYPLLRDELLRSHYWNFAIKRVTLTPDVTPPVHEFSAAFTLPADCLKIVSTGLDNYEQWESENRKIVCDADTVDLTYVAKITDVTKFDDSFCEVLAWKLCSACAYAVTKNATLQQTMEAKYQEILKTARSFDAQEGSIKTVVSDFWMRSRY